MINDLYCIAAIALGLICAAGLAIYSAIVGRHRLTESLPAFLSGAGIIGGIKVCAIAVSSSLPVSSTDRTYIFLGGLAVVFLAIESIAARVRNVRRGNE